jgi:nicotinate-nucleotide pyrophosphorylase (carboxylating)
MMTDAGSPATPPWVEQVVDTALAEDSAFADVTSTALIPRDLAGCARIVAKADGVLAGVDVAVAVFRRVDPAAAFRGLMRDGDALSSGSVVAEVEGPLWSILVAERTALNFLQRLSGVATETRRYVEAVRGHHARIVDTRKTTPGLRELEKRAVKSGGGHNHRRNLADGVLIKDNHIRALAADGIGVGGAVAMARDRTAHTNKIEVEVADLAQLEEALDAGAEVVMLDNMGIRDMAAAVEMADGRAITEASGGVTLDDVRDVAATGVDLISVGALTHSAPALDIALDLVEWRGE